MLVPFIISDLLFLVFLVLSFRTERYRAFEFGFFFLAAIQFALIVGSRVTTYGVDSPRYVAYFYAMASGPLRNAFLPYWNRPLLIWHGDAGINVVMWAIGHIYLDPNFFLVCVALIMALLMASGIYLTSLSPQSKLLALLFCFLSYGMLLQFGNTLRQGLAIAIMFPAVSLWIERKKRFWPIVLWFLASETHLFTSLLILAAVVGAWIIKKLKPKTFGYLLLLVISLVIAVGIHHILVSHVKLGALFGIAKTYADIGSSSAIYIRLGLIILLSFVAVRVLPRPDSWLNLFLSIVLMTVMMISSPEGDKRLVPIVFLAQPVVMVRVIERFRLSSWTTLIVGTAYAASAMVFSILPPMVTNFQF